MMMSVMRCPPDGSFLSRGCPHESQDELKPPARLVAAMGEVAMVDTCNAEHADCIKRDAHSKGCPTKADPNDCQAADMDQPKDSLLRQVYRMDWISLKVHFFIVT